MAIKCINLVQVICDDCGTSIMLDTWQAASKLGWDAPIDGAFQRCPVCSEKHTQALFRAAKLQKIADECPLSQVKEPTGAGGVIT